MSERDYLAKEEALKRLSGPEGDHELHTALERMDTLISRTCGRCSTGYTSHTTPIPQSLRSGEGRRRVAKRRSGHPIMTRPCTSCRCPSSSFRKILARYAHRCWTGTMRASENSEQAKFAECIFRALR
jgi:hypothetical protein